MPGSEAGDLLHRLRRSRPSDRRRVARGGRGTDVGLGHSVPALRRRKAPAGRASLRRALRRLRSRCGADGGHRDLRRHRRLQRRSGGFGQGASCRQAVFPRHQFGLARPQAGDCKAPWRRRPLYRRRRARAHPSGAPSNADAHCRPRRRDDCADARRARYARRYRRSRNRRRRRDQDGAQRDDQGHRGAHPGMFFGRRARRRDRRSRRLDEKQLSRPRLGKDRALQSRTHGNSRRAARRRDGRGRRHVARTRRRAVDDDGHRQAPAQNGADSAVNNRCAARSRRTAPRCSALSAPPPAIAIDFSPAWMGITFRFVR